MKALEAQRSVLGDAIVDSSLKALQLQQQIEELAIVQSYTLQSEGERRHATVLFSDLSGYTVMNEKLDPETVQELMTRIKSGAIRIVEHQGGTVNQFVGDEILALFGIPNTHEDDPIHAVRAALELHEMVRGMSKEVEPLIGRPLTFHSGINTGLIITTEWDDRDGRFGVTGDTVNTGARLLAQAKENEILVSPETQRLISSYFKTESLKPVKMKGKAEPMVPHRILGDAMIQTRLDAAKQRGFTTHIGRKKELATLNACLEKTIQGEGQLVTISGDRGLGKSRLIYEFCQNLDRKKINVLQGRCQSDGISTPYLPFLYALRRILHLKDVDSHSILHEKVVTNLTKFNPALKKYIPVFLHLLSIPSDQYSLPEELAGDKLKQTIQEALVTINTINTKHKTLVWILEDWHWADEASNATLIKHLDIMASYPLLIVVLYRSEYSPKWNKLHFNTHIDLKPIDEKGAKSMIKSIYGVDRLPKKFASQIFQHSGGNPFFIEELCDLLKEEETVMMEDGRIRLQKPIEQNTLPETIQAVIRAKIDRLSAEPREVIRLASVIGKVFLQYILEQIATDIENLPNSLENLKAFNLIRQIENLPEKTYQFKNAIIQEVTYQSLLIKQRSLLHRLVGETVEALFAERLEEQFEVLAYHYSKSAEKEKALHYLELTGDKAAKNFSLLDARTYYKDAMELIDAHPMANKQKATLQKRKRITISLKWAQISHYAGPEDFISILEASLAYARELNEEPKIAHLNYWLGQRNYMIGNLKQSIEYFTNCIELAKKWNEKVLLAQAYAALGRVYFFEAEYLKANDFLENGIPILKELGEKDDVAYAEGFLCGSYAFTGDFEKALYYGKQAIKIENLSRKTNSYMWLSIGYLFQGAWEKSIEACNQSIKIARTIGDVTPIINGLVWFGYNLFMNGKREKGMIKIQKGIKMMEDIKIYLLYSMNYSFQAYC
ncbi:MAG: adenylate/guanylate cyclase domain-containing protein, partial [Desulfobacterales bacterium]